MMSVEALSLLGYDMTCDTTANQCRRMGIKIGDTIEGTEAGPSGYWNTARLTLIWIGESVAVWKVTTRSHKRNDWSEPYEAANWTLAYRDWKKISESRGDDIQKIDPEYYM